MAMPDFLIIGVPKAGTTALHAALLNHPEIHLSRVKEPKFFLSDGRPPRHGGPGDAQTYQEHVWRRSAYEALFDTAPPGTVRGEATPFYLYDLAAQRRIAATIPRVKLIACLRDPVDRAYSNWTHLWSDGLEPESDFLRACALEERRKAAGWAPFWHYLSQGRYGSQLEHLHRLFPPDQVLVLRYRDLRDTPRATLDRVCAFLGVTPGVVGAVPSENVHPFVANTARNRAIQRALRLGASFGMHVPTPLRNAVSRPLVRALHAQSVPRPSLTAAQREHLLRHFADDIPVLERITGESFQDWLIGGDIRVAVE